MTPYRARFVRFELRPLGSGKLRVDCLIENASKVVWAEGWSGTEGKAPSVGPVRLAWQVLDAQSGLLVVDGERTGMGGTCAPRQQFRATMDIQLPPEEGEYRVVISPVQEQVAWFSERGSQYLEAEVSSAPERVSIRRVRRTTRARQRARRLAQLGFRFFWYPWRTLLRYRSLIGSLVRREIQGKYRGSMGGALWTLAQPLLLMVAYYFVFGLVLRVRFGPGQGSGDFVFYFLCGMLPWLAFSEAVGRSPNVVWEHSNFVRRVVFPLEILPVNLTLVGLATEGFALLVFLAALVGLGRGITWTAAYLPFILGPQLLLTVGLCWFLAALGVFFRDVGQMMSFVLTVWFFITPICYPPAALPESWLWLLQLNPIYSLVASYRAIFLESSAPPWGAIAALWGVSLALFWFGHAWFYKAKRSFADLI